MRNDHTNKEEYKKDNNVTFGQINFRNNRNNKMLKLIFKSTVFVLIAANSGGITGAYVSQRIANNYDEVGKDRNINYSPYIAKTQNMHRNSIANITAQIIPAVVGISCGNSDSLSDDDNYGSGVIFRKDGYIATNYHIVKDSKNICVKVSGNNKIFQADVVGADNFTDVAVIKINVKDMPVVNFADSTYTKIGDSVIAIGNPSGQDSGANVDSGIISTNNAKMSMVDTSGNCAVFNVIKTDAAINSLNSGGPLCDEDGNIIGLNDSKLGVDSQGNEIAGKGAAIASSEVKRVIEQIMSAGHVTRISLGVYGQPVVVPNNSQGLFVQQVVHKSGAESSGIAVGDIILSINGMKVSNMNQIQDIIENHKQGEKVKVKLIKTNGAKTSEVNVVLSSQ